MGHAMERRRCQQDRVWQIDAEEGCTEVARRDVDERAIAEAASLERGTVRGDGALVLRAARDEVIRHGGQCVARDTLELVQVQLGEGLHRPQASRPISIDNEDV